MFSCEPGGLACKLKFSNDKIIVRDIKHCTNYFYRIASKVEMETRNLNDMLVSMFMCVLRVSLVDSISSDRGIALDLVKNAIITLCLLSCAPAKCFCMKEMSVDIIAAKGAYSVSRGDSNEIQLS